MTTFAIRAVTALMLAAFPLAATDLTGKWAFTWDTPGGVRESTLEFAQDGESLTVKTEDGSELKGKVEGSGFQVAGQLYSPEAGYRSKLEFSGKIEGEKLSGRGAWDVHAVSFTAARAN